MQYSFSKAVILFVLLCAQCCKQPTHQHALNSINKAVNNHDDSDDAKKLLAAYPDFITSVTSGKVIFKDNSFLTFDDGVNNKSWDQLINNPSVKDQFIFQYIKGKPDNIPLKNEDPGRVRNETFFKKMYGQTKEEVEKNLVEIDWLPHTLHQKIKITHINDVDKHLAAVSNELDKNPALSKYLTNIGGTFNWRYIKNTKRLSEHSFGIAIDINTSFSNYWMWDCKCTDELSVLSYHNRIPFSIVSIFEKHGFIWGGKWYHYDTMHFEYRPELCSSLPDASM